MGARNRDRISLSELRHQGETVADMWKSRWRVRAQCENCGVELTVNLLNVIRLNGPDLSLWFKTTRCRRVLPSGACTGRMYFKALAPGAAGYEFMGHPPRIRRPLDGPMSRGRGAFIAAADIEPPEVTKALGPGAPLEAADGPRGEPPPSPKVGGARRG